MFVMVLLVNNAVVVINDSIHDGGDVGGDDK